jgi:hypothetical protein
LQFIDKTLIKSLQLVEDKLEITVILFVAFNIEDIQILERKKKEKRC